MSKTVKEMLSALRRRGFSLEEIAVRLNARYSSVYAWAKGDRNAKGPAEKLIKQLYNGELDD